MLGLFINTLPLRVRLNPEESLAELLAGIQESQTRLLAFQHVSLAEIKQQAKCGELFDTLVVFENYPLDDAVRIEPATGLRVSDIQIRDATHYPLALMVIPRARLRLRLDYDPARFERATAETIAALFLRLLDQAVATPDISVGQLSLLTEEETKQIVVDWNRTAVPYPADRCVHEEFERHARIQPDALAITGEGESLSYRELDERSDRLAHYLRRHGIVAGSRVALCIDRSIEMIVGMLGILKAGGSYVPLDPASPAERQACILKEVAASIVLTISEVANSLPLDGAKVICLDREWSLIEADKAEISWIERARPQPTSRDPAYVMFTSGSTGTPKGVVVPHRAITRLVLKTNYVELGAQDRIAHLSNVCFDAATFEIWGALLTGACLVPVPKTAAIDPLRLGAELERHKVSTVFVTTALFNELAAANPRIFQSVKQVLFGGEAVNPKAVRQVLESGGPPRRLLHVYGPTECTTFATFYTVTHVEENATTIPIGRPISNTTAYVLDKHGNPLPVGVPGELYLGGPGVAEGYLNQPELTRERFIPDPFAADKNQRLYRTGDIVKYLPDGSIEFVGRLDSQTKIRGFRIEPGEIEAILKCHPEVENAVIVIREEQTGQRQLVGYVVARSDNILTTWRTYLAAKLPVYMIPSTIVRVQELPTTSSGKIDRLALPKPERQIERDLPSLTPFEEMAASVWSDVLRREGCRAA